MGAGAEGGGVGVVDVRDAVLGAVHERDQAGEAAEKLLDGEVLEGGDVGGPGHVGGGGRLGLLGRLVDESPQ